MREVHLITTGRERTVCCGRTPAQLPVSQHRLTGDPEQVSCLATAEKRARKLLQRAEALPEERRFVLLAHLASDVPDALERALDVAEGKGVRHLNG